MFDLKNLDQFKNEVNTTKDDTKIIKLGFARVSTKGQDLTHQISELSKVDGLDPANILSYKHSGKKETNLQAMNELITLIEDKTRNAKELGVNVRFEIYATKIDRIGRSMSQIMALLNTLTDLGAAIITLDGKIDTSERSALKDYLLATFGFFAELERELIVTRTAEGKAAKGADGIGGRPSKSVDVNAFNDKYQAIKLDNPKLKNPAIAEMMDVSLSTLKSMLSLHREVESGLNARIHALRNADMTQQQVLEVLSDEYPKLSLNVIKRNWGYIPPCQ